MKAGGAQCGARSVVKTATRPAPAVPTAISGASSTVTNTSASGLDGGVIAEHGGRVPTRWKCRMFLDCHRFDTLRCFDTVVTDQ